MAVTPIHRCSVAQDKQAMVTRVILHHLHQPVADFGIVVHDEQLHYWGGAVNGAGNSVNNLVGSARLSCS
jgi:hypothetical protein